MDMQVQIKQVSLTFIMPTPSAGRTGQGLNCYFDILGVDSILRRS